jgi:hypothetical protein
MILKWKFHFANIGALGFVVLPITVLVGCLVCKKTYYDVMSVKK